MHEEQSLRAYEHRDCVPRPTPRLRSLLRTPQHLPPSPIPSTPKNPATDIVSEAWRLVHRRAYEPDVSWEVDACARAGVARARYNDAEWYSHLTAIKDKSYETFVYDSYELPVEVVAEFDWTLPRSPALLWFFFRVNVRRWVRVRRLVYDWYAPYCGAPRHLDFEAERASARRGIVENVGSPPPPVLARHCSRRCVLQGEGGGHRRAKDPAVAKCMQNGTRREHPDGEVSPVCSQMASSALRLRTRPLTRRRASLPPSWTACPSTAPSLPRGGSHVF